MIMNNMNMKKIIFALLAFVLVCGTSCTKRLSYEEKGYVDLTLNNPLVEIMTKSETPVVVDDSYSVVIAKKDDGSVVRNSTYADLKNTFALETGTYTVYAENISSEEALTARENKGAQRFYGSSEFTVEAGKVTEVSFVCEMVNARVSLGLDESFKSVFKSATITMFKSSEENVEGRREFVFEYNNASGVEPVIEDEDSWIYFNMDEGHTEVNPTTLKMVISVTRNDDLINTYTSEVHLAPKTWFRLNVKSVSIDGNLDLNVVSDNNIIEEDESWGVDPY